MKHWILTPKQKTTWWDSCQCLLPWGVCWWLKDNGRSAQMNHSFWNGVQFLVRFCMEQRIISPSIISGVAFLENSLYIKPCKNILCLLCETELCLDSAHYKQIFHWDHCQALALSDGCTGCVLYSHLLHHVSEWCPLGCGKHSNLLGIFKSCMGHGRILHGVGLS